MTHVKWSPSEYLRFADERSRPFFDLMARVDAADPAYVVDIGCGPGNLTRTLAGRWPAADVEGVDNSPEMIERAQAQADGGVRFTLADLREWQPDRPVDVLTSNATLQWVPGHLEMLTQLVAMLAPGGWLAFQVPGNFGEPSHTELAALSQSPRWQPLLARHDLPVPASEEPEVYLDRLTALGCCADVWETTYLHVLPGEDAVLNWVTGTALRPILSILSPEEQAEFRDKYGERLRASYPRHDYGTVMPYRRIFAVCQASQ